MWIFSANDKGIWIPNSWNPKPSIICLDHGSFTSSIEYPASSIQRPGTSAYLCHLPFMVSTEKRNLLILIKCLTTYPAAHSVLWAYTHNQMLYSKIFIISTIPVVINMFRLNRVSINQRCICVAIENYGSLWQTL